MKRTREYISEEPIEYFISENCGFFVMPENTKNSNKKPKAALKKSKHRSRKPAEIPSYWRVLRSALLQHGPKPLEIYEVFPNIDIEKECKEIKEELDAKEPQEKPLPLPPTVDIAPPRSWWELAWQAIAPNSQKAAK